MHQLKQKINGFDIYFEQQVCDNKTVINTIQIGETRRNLNVLIQQLAWAEQYTFFVKFQFCAVEAFSDKWIEVYREIKELNIFFNENDIVDLDPDFTDALDEMAKKKREPTKKRF